MTDAFAETLQYVAQLEEGDEVGTAADLRSTVVSKRFAEVLPRLLIHLGLAKRGQHKKLRRTGKPVPDLDHLRWAPTEVYLIKFQRVGKAKVFYTKCRAGRLDAKLARFASYDDMRILGVSRAYMTPWVPANGELHARGIQRYEQAG